MHSHHRNQTIETDILIIENWWRKLRGCTLSYKKMFYTIEEIERKVTGCQDAYEYWMNNVSNKRQKTNKKEEEEKEEKRDKGRDIKRFIKMIQNSDLYKDVKKNNKQEKDVEKAWRNILCY